MKLLLTSGGITNNNIAQVILDLVGKPMKDIKAIFIPTAANTVEGDKGWLINDINNFEKQGYASIDILDIAGVPQKVWQPRLEAADLICFGGGNEQYLAKIMKESGLEKLLPKLLQKRLYIGISAGSMVMGQFLSDKLMKIVYPEEVFDELASPLGYVNCHFIPHLNSEYFAHVRKKNLEALKAEFTAPLYALDDNCALKVVDGNIEIIGGGQSVVIQE